MELAEYASVPVINGLTNLLHPCQLMADVLTIKERLGSIAGKKIAWIGDGNNMANTWITVAEKLDFELVLACPESLPPDAEILAAAKKNGARVTLTTSPEAAADGADAIKRGYVGEHGRRRHADAQAGVQWFPSQRRADGAGEEKCPVHALPAGASRRRGDGRGARWAAVGRMGRSGESFTCSKSDFTWCLGEI